MAREDIVIGLENAISKGQSLKDAMQSFYNAGYSQEEVENAARELQYRQQGLSHEIVEEADKTIKKAGIYGETKEALSDADQTLQKIGYDQIQETAKEREKSVQRISNYGIEKKPKISSRNCFGFLKKKGPFIP